MTDMKNAIQRSLPDRAVEFAAVKHSGAFRKGSTIPYITHAVETMEIVSRMTDDEEVRAAAVLHDTLEDTDTTREELVQYFGQRTADLVAAESENKREGQPEKETWMIRKRETINHLEKAGTEIRMIALGDKLSNIRAIYRDRQDVGEKFWERFNQKDPAMHAWYYRTLGEIFGKDKTLRETPAYQEYIRLCDEVFR